MSIILAYHGVTEKTPGKSSWIEYGEKKYELEKLCVSPVLFEKQLDYLHKQGYYSVSLKELVEHQQKGLKVPGKSIIITFDDGFRNFFEIARPLLKKYGFSATIFLVTDKISANDRNFLSWEEILQMKKEGFDFGAHTCSHCVLTEVSLEKAKWEIEQSKKIIEEKLGQKVEFFSYPYGEFNGAIEDLVQEIGFLGAVVTPHGPGIEERPYALKRIGVNYDNSMRVFKFKISSGFSWLREQRFLWQILRKVKKAT